MTKDHPPVSHTTSHDSSKSIDTTSKNEAHHCNDQTFSLPYQFFSVSQYLDNQRVDGWIDDADSHGGRYVRAIISSVTPAVWMKALSGRAHFIGRTYHMEQAMVERRSGNPKSSGSPKRNRVRRAARQRARSKKRGG